MKVALAREERKQAFAETSFFRVCGCGGQPLSPFHHIVRATRLRRNGGQVSLLSSTQLGVLLAYPYGCVNLPLFCLRRTELCAFSEYRIYPGHGQRFIRKDGQPVTLSTSKCKRLLLNRKKPAKLMWTQAWRRLNKKGKEEGIVRKK